jgi:hypothetical protein
MPTSPVTPESKKSSTGLPEPRISINLSRSRSYLYVREIGTSAAVQNYRIARGFHEAFFPNGFGDMCYWWGFCDLSE